jgi:hypothetical protein
VSLDCYNFGSVSIRANETVTGSVLDISGFELQFPARPGAATTQSDSAKVEFGANADRIQTTDEQGATDAMVTTWSRLAAAGSVRVYNSAFGSGFGDLFEPTPKTVQQSPLAT